VERNEDGSYRTVFHTLMLNAEDTVWSGSQRPAIQLSYHFSKLITVNRGVSVCCPLAFSSKKAKT
jgi:hypothetical protein